MAKGSEQQRNPACSMEDILCWTADGCPCLGALCVLLWGADSRIFVLEEEEAVCGKTGAVGDNSAPHLGLSTPCSRAWDILIRAVVSPHPTPRQAMSLHVAAWTTQFPEQQPVLCREPQGCQLLASTSAAPGGFAPVLGSREPTAS